MNQSILQWYFNCIYNPIYDLGVAQSKPYQRLQATCVNKLTLQSGDHILCIGVGTGNELTRILEKEPGALITGVDTSHHALNRAYKKSLRYGRKIDLLHMNAHKLDFADSTFDKVLCIHVMGFLEDDKQATKEMVRVLKKGGQFVATYPSGIGSIKLGGEIAKGIWHDLKSLRLGSAAKHSTALTLGSLSYIPISSYVKPSRGFYSHQSLTEIIETAHFSSYAIDEERDYQDYIVWGIK